MRKVLFFFWFVTLVAGFLFASYGVLRESFVALAQQQGIGQGQPGEDLGRIEESLVSYGLKTGLLPSDRSISIADRRKNAAWAVAGFMLLGLSILFDLGLKATSRARASGKYVLP